MYLYIMEHFYLQCSSMFSLTRYRFYLLFTIFFKKHWYSHVFIWMVKKGSTALGVLLTRQILLFEHCIENNLITCGLFSKWCVARFGTIKKTCKTPIEEYYFKSDIPPWVFFTLFKLHKWYQIAQSIWYTLSMNILSKRWWRINNEYFPHRRLKITN